MENFSNKGLTTTPLHGIINTESERDNRKKEVNKMNAMVNNMNAVVNNMNAMNMVQNGADCPMWVAVVLGAAVVGLAVAMGIAMYKNRLG